MLLFLFLLFARRRVKLRRLRTLQNRVVQLIAFTTCSFLFGLLMLLRNSQLSVIELVLILSPNITILISEGQFYFYRRWDKVICIYIFL